MGARTYVDRGDLKDVRSRNRIGKASGERLHRVLDLEDRVGEVEMRFSERGETKSLAVERKTVSISLDPIVAIEAEMLRELARCRLKA